MSFYKFRNKNCITHDYRNYVDLVRGLRWIQCCHCGRRP